MVTPLPAWLDNQNNFEIFINLSELFKILLYNWLVMSLLNKQSFNLLVDASSIARVTFKHTSTVMLIVKI